MTSSCIWQYDEGETMEPCTTKLVKARKPHCCCECAVTINVGDLHEYVRGLYDGEWETYRTCARCLNVHADYFAGRRVLGCMVEDFEAEHGFDYRDGIPADFAPCRESFDA
jgi:hypothetical protein